MGQGYVADTTGLAIRVGELQAVAGEVDGVIGLLDISGGDLGPGDLSAAVAEVADQWRSGLDEMRGKIEQIADNVRGAAYNYDLQEDLSEQRMRALAEGKVVESQMNMLRGAAAVTLARQQGAGGDQQAGG